MRATTRSRSVAALLGTAAAAFALLSAGEAEAQLIIKNPSDHPDYRAELEPHAVFVPWGDYVGYRRNYYRNHAIAGGIGFRATIEIVDPVIPKLNNTIGITFGLDFTNCPYCYRGQEYSFWTPIGAQWNFFLTRKWSVFGEVGGVLHSDGFYHDVFVEPMFAVGGRYHFRDKITLTMRLGVPYISLGVSFMI
ncbi:MAG: hypothetical protein R3B70_01580 [Polyangiaceae bacterium]